MTVQVGDVDGVWGLGDELLACEEGSRLLRTHVNDVDVLEAGQRQILEEFATQSTCAAEGIVSTFQRSCRDTTYITLRQVSLILQEGFDDLQYLGLAQSLRVETIRIREWTWAREDLVQVFPANRVNRSGRSCDIRHTISDHSKGQRPCCHSPSPCWTDVDDLGKARLVSFVQF